MSQQTNLDEYFSLKVSSTGKRLRSNANTVKHADEYDEIFERTSPITKRRRTNPLSTQVSTGRTSSNVDVHVPLVDTARNKRTAMVDVDEQSPFDDVFRTTITRKKSRTYHQQASIDPLTMFEKRAHTDVQTVTIKSSSTSTQTKVKHLFDDVELKACREPTNTVNERSIEVFESFDSFLE
jgi:hypothetical protein